MLISSLARVAGIAAASFLVACFSLFPPSAYAESPRATHQDDPVAPLVNGMFEAGWSVPIKGADLARVKYEAAVESYPDDARLSYSLGLLLMKHYKYKDAEKVFRASSTQGTQPYVPALQAAIHLQVRRKSYTHLWGDILRFGRTISDSSRSGHEENLKSHVEWIGAIMGYLDGPAGNQTYQEYWEQTEQKLLEILPADCHEIYADASSGVIDQFVAMSRMIADVKKKAIQTEESRREKRKEEIAGEKEEVAGKREDLLETAEEWKQWATRGIENVDRQYAGLERSYNQTALAARDVDNSRRSVNYEMSRLGSSRDQAIMDEDTGRAADLDRRIRNLARYKSSLDVEYTALAQQAAVIQSHAGTLLRERQAILQRYQRETGGILKNAKKVNKLGNKLLAEEAKLAKPISNNIGKIRTLATRAAALTSYIRFDLERSKQALLESLGPVK